MQVTDEVAAGGRRALRVRDELEGYEPHFYAYSVRRQGMVAFPVTCVSVKARNPPGTV